MTTRIRNNEIGRSIYERIKDYDLASRKAFLLNLSPEHKTLYNKYNAVERKRRSLENEMIKERAKEAAKEGMRKYRESKDKEEIKLQRIPWDKKYEEKRKLSRQEAAKIIQDKFRKNKKEQEEKTYNKSVATRYAKNMINDLFSNQLETLPIKRNVGRPKRPRNPVGRPRKAN